MVVTISNADAADTPEHGGTKREHFMGKSESNKDLKNTIDYR